MSKQQDRKKFQQYNPKPVNKSCSNCEHFKSEFETVGYGYQKEINIHCGLGGFAVKKTGVCFFHNFKPQQ